MINLDTNVLLAFFENRLNRDEERVLVGQPFGISAMVLWELYALAAEGSLRVDPDSPEVARDLGRLHVWPITTHVSRQMRYLDFSSDPGDGLIAATSIAHNAPLLTRDTRMLASKVVPLALP